MQDALPKPVSRCGVLLLPLQSYPACLLSLGALQDAETNHWQGQKRLFVQYIMINVQKCGKRKTNDLARA